MTDRLDVGAVIRRVFDIYVDQAPVLLPASAVVFVITGIVTALLVAAASGLALETGAPVVPIAIHGSSRVRNWKRLQFPRVTVQYGEPIRWERVAEPTREQQQAVADQILVEIRRMYAGLDEYGRQGVRRRLQADSGAGNAPVTA